ncbi:MAG TPA: peptide ABC transporter substrate-binding protein [Terriglobia bacterium]|nr:peptide ABC transporter substrate-binding protein [Terriglobia bacterium]
MSRSRDRTKTFTGTSTRNNVKDSHRNSSFSGMPFFGNLEEPIMESRVSDTQTVNSGDSLSRAALRQIALLAVAGVVGFVLLMGLLSRASNLTGSGAGALGAVDFKTKTITIALEEEPPQIDGTRATDTVSFRILGHVMEGLLRYDASGHLAPAVAERWEINAGGATFWLRENALWSDGKPVTARDFVFAWQTVVDPATASEYAFIMYPIKNAEAINNKKLPRAALGVHAIGDRELRVEFERPIAFFDKLVAFGVYNPVREDFYRSRQGRYGADATDTLYNGPFTITRWVHGAHVRLEKNSRYWNRDAVRLDVIDMPYITSDTGAVVNLYKSGAVARATLDKQQLGDAMRLGWNVGRYNDGSVFYLDFNFRPGRITANHNLRKALQLVSDSGELVNKVIALPGYQPAVSLFPAWLKGVEKSFRQEYPPEVITPDYNEARRRLDLAKKELGLEQIPPLVLLTDDSPLTNRQSEYFQDLFKRTLGLEIRIDKQIFKQRLAKMTSGDYDIVMAGWGPDFDDPLTFGDLFASWNANNRGRYNNPELDRQVRVAQSSLDPKTRMDAFGKIQQILIDDAVILPSYERGRVYVQDSRLKGVVYRAVGADPDYTNAYLDESRQ